MKVPAFSPFLEKSEKRDGDCHLQNTIKALNLSDKLSGVEKHAVINESENAFKKAVLRLFEI